MNVERLIEPYLCYRAAKWFGQRQSDRVYLKKHFCGFLQEQGKILVEDLTPDLLDDFAGELSFKKTAAGRFYAIATRNKILSVVRGLCRWLVDQDYLASDPSRRLESAKEPQRLPRHVLDEKEVYQLLESIDMSTTLGFRDRVIMELFYGTGIRKGELRQLKVNDVDLEGGYLFVEQGKGRKDRVVPLGEGLCKLIREYLLFIRPKLCTYSDNPYLIITYQRKGPLCNAQIIKRVKICAENSLVKKNVYPHLLRHSCATHMIRRGAPLRHVQELLGHRSVVSTQIYTHITIMDLKKAHAKYHPRERMDRK